jgi:hypothetical protein
MVIRDTHSKSGCGQVCACRVLVQTRNTVMAFFGKLLAHVVPEEPGDVARKQGVGRYEYLYV